MVETSNQSQLDRISAHVENNRDCRSCAPGGHCRGCTADSRNYRHLTTNKIGRQLRQASVVSVRPTIFDRDILTFDEAGFTQTFAKTGGTGSVRLRRLAAEIADHRHRRPLRPRRQRPSCRRAAETDNELPPPHSETPRSECGSLAAQTRRLEDVRGRLNEISLGSPT